MATIEKIIGCAWFNNIGIILKESEGEETVLRAYISHSNLTNEEQAMLFIAEYGVKFPIIQAVQLIQSQGNFNEKYKGTINIKELNYTKL
jgi:hypothetical protein